MKCYIFQGGSDETNNDYSALREASKTGREFDFWSSVKDAKAGDVALFYILRPISAIVAKGRILEDARSGKHWRYEARVGEIEWLSEPLTLKKLRSAFPDWGWARTPRGRVILSESRAKRLLELSGNAGVEPSRREVTSGGGFGHTEDNWKVERAAVKAVTRHFRRMGYSVKSVESENLGYDLVCQKRGVHLHVEVKGSSGAGDAFLLTPNEKRQAGKDPRFRLALVNRALSPKPELNLFTGREMLATFSITPVSYMAKRNGSV